MRMNRSRSVDNLTFTAAVTVASRTLLVRDKLLGRIKRTPSEDPSLEISRYSIASGDEVLDAVLVAPARKPARAALLICHGIGETVDHWFKVQKLLAAEGVASLVFDYAGFGRSTGHIAWKQCEQDTIEAFRTLKALFPHTPVSLLGFSLGSGIAAAVLDCVLPQNLILCSSFTSFQAATSCVGLPRGLSFLAPPIWNTEETLHRCSPPVLVVHCERDRLFPARMAFDLAANCKTPTKPVIVSDHQHNDPFYRPQRQYWDHVVSVLTSDHHVSQQIVSEVGD